MVYNAYTSKDVKHLIEYLAENNRDGKGRHGNKIYQQLVENVRGSPFFQLPNNRVYRSKRSGHGARTTRGIRGAIIISKTMSN